MDRSSLLAVVPSVVAVLLAALLGVSSCDRGAESGARTSSSPTALAPTSSQPATPTDEPPVPAADREVVAFRVPLESEIPAGPEGEAIRRGKAIAERTGELLPENVGSRLRCASCHLGTGTVQNAGPWVGIDARFPQYRARSGKVDSLEDRINDCFERSLNGAALPEDSQPMRDLRAYMTFLSKGVEEGQDVEGSGIPLLELPRAPDLTKGKVVYDTRCAACHAMDGQGIVDASGKTVFPPLWGDATFNIAAGMARQRTLAGFVHENMPLGQGGTLTRDEAWDVAGFVGSMPRPDFEKKRFDWPKGDKPPDAPY